MVCEKLEENLKLYACGLHYRDPKNLDNILCMLCINHYWLESPTNCAYDKNRSMCIDPQNLDKNGNCVECDNIRGNWATGLSLDENGEVIGNICEYKRNTDQLRVLWWVESVLSIMITFGIAAFVIMVVCCYISFKTAKPPKEAPRVAADDNGLEEDLMIQSYMD
jgi:uncharacterized protein YuzE